MSDIQQYNDIEIVEIIENEGLGYAVRHYMDAANVQNPVTAELWSKAAAALNALSEHLKL